MSETEIALAQAYLARSGLDPVAALVRSVRDIARMRRMLAATATIEARPEVAHSDPEAHRLTSFSRPPNSRGSSEAWNQVTRL